MPPSIAVQLDIACLIMEHSDMDMELLDCHAETFEFWFSYQLMDSSAIQCAEISSGLNSSNTVRLCAVRSWSVLCSNQLNVASLLVSQADSKGYYMSDGFVLTAAS